VPEQEKRSGIAEAIMVKCAVRSRVMRMPSILG